MRPVLFHIGPLPLYSFGFVISLGLILALYLMSRRSKRTGFPLNDDASDLVFITVAAGFLGARIQYIFQNADWYLEHPLKIFAIWEGGLIFYGGMISSLIVLAICMRAKKIPFLKGLDFLMPYVAMVHAFGRIGCFFNGCCYGKVCDLPWAVRFPGLESAIHPTQLYEAVFDFLLFIFLNKRYETKRFEGEISCLYFVIYPAGRFIIEFFRTEPSWMFFSWNQWISLATFAVAGIIYLSQWKKNKTQ